MSLVVDITGGQKKILLAIQQYFVLLFKKKNVIAEIVNVSLWLFFSEESLRKREQKSQGFQKFINPKKRGTNTRFYKISYDFQKL